MKTKNNKRQTANNSKPNAFETLRHDIIGAVEEYQHLKKPAIPDASESVRQTRSLGRRCARL